MAKKRKQNSGNSCAAFAVTPLQYSLLSALAARETADQTTLAADVALDRTTTTGALKRLQSRHFIERTVDREDRRARVCRLTGAGIKLLANMEAAARTAHRDTLASLSKAEQKSFVAMMQRVVAANPNQTRATVDLE
jgi:MarR family transcriptional regulator, lower aerobic nicotinate degradation pathway regulator